MKILEFILYLLLFIGVPYWIYAYIDYNQYNEKTHKKTIKETKFKINDLVWYYNSYGTRTFFYVDEIWESEDGPIYIARWLRRLDNQIVEYIPEKILHNEGPMPVLLGSLFVSNGAEIPNQEVNLK